MKRYKLIKDFPSNDIPLGSVVEPIQPFVEGVKTYYSSSIWNKDKTWTYTRLLDKKDVEDFPEFWEEITNEVELVIDGEKQFVDKETKLYVLHKKGLREGVGTAELCNKLGGNETFYIFSTEEKRDKFIKENRPYFSYKEITEILRAYESATVVQQKLETLLEVKHNGVL